MKNAALFLSIACGLCACDSSSVPAEVAQASAAGKLVCTSLEKVAGWRGVQTNDFLTLSADIVSGSELRGARVLGAYGSDRADVSADADYRPRNPAYADMNRFGSLEDAWNWFFPLLPKDLAQKEPGSRFTGYLQIVGEQEYKGTVEMACEVR